MIMLVDSLNAEQIENKISLSLDNLVIAVYSPALLEPSGNQKQVNVMEEYGFPGYLLLSTSFFHKFHLQKPANSQSQMKNIAKAFFKYDEKNHACLVQYLHPDSSSSDHYHSLEEYIVLLAGKVDISMRPVEEDRDKIIKLAPGNILVIPPRTWHKVLTYEVGSITVPIKQTIKGRKDHFYE